MTYDRGVIMLFETSDTYKQLDGVHAAITTLMREELVNNFVAHLHDERYSRYEEYTEIPFLEYLVKEGSYGEVVGGNDPVMDLYDILAVASHIFTPEQFGRAVEDRLEKLYSDETSEKFCVKVLEHSESWDLPRERMFFSTDRYWGSV